MKYTLLIEMALVAILFLAVGPSFGITTEMQHGTDATVTGAGATTAIAEYDVTSTLSGTQTTNTVSANILAIASTVGKGTADVDITVPEQAAKSSGGLKVSANGEATASVSSTDSSASVAALAQIYSKAESIIDSAGSASDSISGTSYLLSEIGKTSTGTGVTGSATGAFTASSYVDGTAKYEGSVDAATFTTSTTDTVPKAVSGAVSGITSLEADVSDGYLNGVQTAQLEADSSITFDTTDTLLAYASDIVAQNTNLVSVEAIIPATTTDLSGEASTVAGTADGSVASNAESSLTDTATTVNDYDYTAIASTTNGILSADVSVSAIKDDALAQSQITPKAELTSTGTGVAYQYEDTSTVQSKTNLVRRTSGEDTAAFSEAFVTNGVWSAETVSHSADRDVQVSGNLAEVEGSAGIGAGTFLQNIKTGPATASISLSQDAKLTPTVAYTATNTVAANILGPKATGASDLDGTGVYGAFANLNTEYTTGTTTQTSDVSSVNALLWVDGTSPLMWQGYGVDASGISFDPTGTITPVSFTYTQSPTQRQTLVNFGTSQ